MKSKFFTRAALIALTLNVAGVIQLQSIVTGVAAAQATKHRPPSGTPPTGAPPTGTPPTGTPPTGTPPTGTPPSGPTK
jgi:hypothetical protein